MQRNFASIPPPLDMLLLVRFRKTATALSTTCLLISAVQAAKPETMRGDTTDLEYALLAASPTSSYAILLSVSEEAPVNARAIVATQVSQVDQGRQVQSRRQAWRAQYLPQVPNFDRANQPETPELARDIQLATAHRLRGETIEAARYYAKIVAVSNHPIHLFCFAEAARANGDLLLANHMESRYAAAQVGAPGPTPVQAAAPISGQQTSPMRLAGIITDARTGKVVVGVTVRALDPIALVEQVASTDANGLFVLDGITAGAVVQVQATHPSFEISLLEVATAETAASNIPIVGVRLYLQPSAELVGVN